MKKLQELSNEELMKKMKSYRPIIIGLVVAMFLTLITLMVLRINHLFTLFILIPFAPVYIRFNQLYKESRKRNL
ncbi:hypothetical protein [Sunxiuqinia indica]|uniref:hypothetical protein n=1 Tax=Sunxiuqinia indica TaxID=2692584 RepID=UPI0013589747|nr:hypothetical protein [Sunxiuqinia indica]